MSKSELVERLRGLAGEIGTVRQVASRRSDPDADHRQMLTRLEDWRVRANRVADELDVLLSEIREPQEATPKPPREFYNTKWTGEGFGKVGDHRVILRRERKGVRRAYVQIIDDEDGIGLGFTAKEIEALIPALQRAAHAAWGREAAPSPRAALGFDTPWPVTDVLRRLADAADHLLNDHNCDTHGWEGICVARDRAREIATAIEAAPSPRADDALRYAIALMTNRLPVEAPTNAAIIRQHIADLDRLRAQPLTPVAERGWQPIETAPAGCMLLFCSMRALEVPKWCWVDWLAGGSLNLHADWKATHWMPLPAPPASGERTER